MPMGSMRTLQDEIVSFSHFNSELSKTELGAKCSVRLLDSSFSEVFLKLLHAFVKRVHSRLLYHRKPDFIKGDRLTPALP
jgi:hypothetical protein